jgi:hypothetical protein
MGAGETASVGVLVSVSTGVDLDGVNLASKARASASNFSISALALAIFYDDGDANVSPLKKYLRIGVADERTRIN